MTIPVPHVERTTDITEDTYSAHIRIQDDTAIPDGVRTMGRSRYVPNVTDDIRTFLLSGPISSDDTWEIRITKKPSVELGLSVSSLKRKEKKSPLTIDLNVDESSNSDLPAKRELSGL